MSRPSTFFRNDPANPTTHLKPASVTNLAFGQTLTPWHCQHHEGVSVIEAYSVRDGKRHMVAETFGAPGVNAEVTANMIIAAVNEREKIKEIIDEMLSALELCLGSRGLSWEAEQQVDSASLKAKEWVNKLGSVIDPIQIEGGVA